MCSVFGVSASAYYEWEREQESAHERRDGELLELIRAVFARFRGRYGAPRIQGRLAREGVLVSRKRVARLMREAGLRAKGARKYKATTDSKHALPVAPNLLERRFDVDQPNVAWVSDITYLWTRQGWMYLAVIIDLFAYSARSDHPFRRDPIIVPRIRSGTGAERRATEMVRWWVGSRVGVSDLSGGGRRCHGA